MATGKDKALGSWETVRGREAAATSRSQIFENGLSVSEGRWNCKRTICRPERQEHLTECACIDVLEPGTPLPSLHGSLLPPSPPSPACSAHPVHLPRNPGGKPTGTPVIPYFDMQPGGTRVRGSPHDAITRLWTRGLHDQDPAHACLGASWGASFLRVAPLKVPKYIYG